MFWINARFLRGFCFYIDDYLTYPVLFFRVLSKQAAPEIGLPLNGVISCLGDWCLTGNRGLVTDILYILTMENFYFIFIKEKDSIYRAINTVSYMEGFDETLTVKLNQMADIERSSKMVRYYLNSIIFRAPLIFVHLVARK